MTRSWMTSGFFERSMISPMNPSWRACSTSLWPKRSSRSSTCSGVRPFSLVPSRARTDSAERAAHSSSSRSPCAAATEAASAGRARRLEAAALTSALALAITSLDRREPERISFARLDRPQRGCQAARHYTPGPSSRGRHTPPLNKTTRNESDNENENENEYEYENPNAFRSGSRLRRGRGAPPLRPLSRGGRSENTGGTLAAVTERT